MSTQTQITYTEPADRPVSVALSQGEIYTLVIHHEKQAKSIHRAAVKAIGEHAKTKADIDAVRKHAERKIAAHQNRCKGLYTILQTIINQKIS